MSVAPDWIKFYAIVHWTLAYTTAYTAVQAVYMMCVSINGPGDPDLWPFELGCESRLRWGTSTFIPNLGMLGFSNYSLYVTGIQTDRQTDAY